MRAFLARTLRAARGFRAADFFAELFFFFGLAIAFKRPRNRLALEKWTLN